MPSKKPLVIVTRKLPEAIETRMMELFDTRLNLDDTPLTQAQLVAAVLPRDLPVEGRASLLLNERGKLVLPRGIEPRSHGYRPRALPLSYRSVMAASLGIEPSWSASKANLLTRGLAMEADKRIELSDGPGQSRATRPLANPLRIWGGQRGSNPS